jgi:hypothetical protein
MAPQQGIFVYVTEGLSFRAQVVEVGVSEEEKWGYPRIAEMGAW